MTPWLIALTIAAVTLLGAIALVKGGSVAVKVAPGLDIRVESQQQIGGSAIISDKGRAKKSDKCPYQQLTKTRPRLLQRYPSVLTKRWGSSSPNSSNR
jgi:hypothetical protein